MPLLMPCCYLYTVSVCLSLSVFCPAVCLCCFLSVVLRYSHPSAHVSVMCWLVSSLYQSLCHVSPKKEKIVSRTILQYSRMGGLAHAYGLVQGCSNSIDDALELMQSCTKPTMHGRNCMCLLHK